MRKFILLGLMVVSPCWANSSVRTGDQTPSQIQTQPNASSLTVPSGTVIPATLATPITGKDARKGTAVHALTGYPVTIGNQTLIPAGATVDGVIDEVYWHRHREPGMRVHFTKLTYPNGYSVPIDAISNTESAYSATARPPAAGYSGASDSIPHFELATYRMPNGLSAAYEDDALPSGARYVLAAQTMPPQPLPHSGPGVGTFIGIAVAAAAAIIVTAVFEIRHARNGVAFDVGWPFSMVLQSPLSLDAANVSPPAAQ